MEEIRIRRLEMLAEYSAAESLQQECWGSGPIEAVPSHLLITAQHEGGLVLGAFAPDGRLVGFVFGFLGRADGRLKHCSHMAAVLPAYRNRHIAYRLKLAQRAAVLAQGLDLCTWTFDPLLYLNARLNIARLGAVSRAYKRNVYGEMRDALNADLPTDRLYVAWELTSARVESCVTSGAPAGTPIAGVLLTEVTTADGIPRLTGRHPLPDAPALGIQIPREFGPIRARAPEAAAAWRAGTAPLFEAAFAAGYTVANITPDPDEPDLLGRYTLLREL